jgi:hypothetical protein
MEQALPARSGKRLCRLAQCQGQRPASPRIEPFERLKNALDIERLGCAQHLDIAAVAAPVTERGHPDAGQRVDLAEPPPHGLAREHELARLRALDAAPH